jgi:hypothetical protein
MISRAQAAYAGNEAAGHRGVARVAAAVGSEQVGLFDEAHLHLDGGHQAHEGGHRQARRHHQGQTQLGDHHRREDRIAYQRKEATGHQLGALGLLDPDAPGRAHPGLSGEHTGEADESEHQAEDAGDVGHRAARATRDVDDGENQRGEAKGRGGDEQDAGPPPQRAGLAGDAVKA